MAQLARQSRLFAAEDYTAVYESYVNANFQAYDFDTIRTSMIDYIRINYAESYNDWVESAEFVALLDVIAMFGHNLAYRIDLNSRNSFLSTAERQDSVFKLAEFLGYQPRRNIPAFGNLKITSVKTNEDVIGSAGTSLGGKEIRYDNSNGDDNIDNFITILNSMFNANSQFGSPLQRTKINNSTVDFYGLNNVADQITFSFTGFAQGTNVDFNAVNVKLDTTLNAITERNPDPNGSFTLMYKNDGGGINSNDNGFFFGFKQGQLAFKDFLIEEPLSGMTLDITEENINNSDVWVQTVSNDGSVTTEWKQVESSYGHNIIYNYLDQKERNIYAVKSRENNQISIQFADESFGNLPTGVIRVWYRTSENITYVLRPDDIGTKRININYVGSDGNAYIATFGVQLKENVINASASESLDDIKTNAPRIYASQDRMITADDYNSYLYTQSDNIRKIKGTNRTHSGHSRYVELRDPTGAYKNLNLFGTDGKLYKTKRVKTSFATDISSASVFENYIKPAISDDELTNLYYSEFQSTFDDIANTQARNVGWIEDIINITSNSPARITTDTSHNFQTGHIVTFAGVVGMTELNGNSYYVRRTGSTSFEIYSDPAATSSPVDSTVFTPYTSGGTVTSDNTKYKWQQIGTSTTGYIIDTSGDIKRIGATVSGFLKYLQVGCLIKFKTPTGVYIWAKLSKSFAYGLGVDGVDGNPTGLTADGNYGAVSLDNIIPNNSTIEVVYPAYARQFTSLERTQIINFLEAKQNFALKYDYINLGWDIIDSDPLPTDSNYAFPSVFDYSTTIDHDSDPATPNRDNNWLIYVSYDTSSPTDKWDISTRTIRYKLQSNQIDFGNITNELQLNEKSGKSQRDVIKISNLNVESLPSSDFYIYGYEFETNGDQSGIYVSDTVILAMVDNNSDARPDNPNSYNAVVTSPVADTTSTYGGSYGDKLRFEWTHIPSEDEIIDPSFTNVIDVYVLTRTYDTEYRSWLTTSRLDLEMPEVPTINELNSSFKQQTNRKAMSDSIIYRPVKYKVVFGDKASTEFQAKFRVIKVPETVYTDNEIRDKVVNSITNFFNIDNWDFGETFYFTELAAYVHKELAGIVSSFVIVPQGSDSVFGDLFQITPNSDELLIPDVDVNDIDIIDSITRTNIRQA